MAARIKTVVVTPFMQNARLVIDTETKAAAVIDPGGDIPKIVSAIEDEGADIQSVILTHSHIDHVAGLTELLKALKQRGVVPSVYGHKAEQFMRQAVAEQALYFGLSPEEYQNANEPDVYIEDGSEIQIGKLKARALFTPGHSPGHVSLYFENGAVDIENDSLQGHGQIVSGNFSFVIAGDALFAGSVGRTDLPGGDHATLIQSIKKKLLTLPDETLVLSGHGPDTSIGIERLSNPFLN